MKYERQEETASEDLALQKDVRGLEDLDAKTKEAGRIILPESYTPP